MFTSYELAEPIFFGSWMRMKMPLFVPWSAQNSARSWKSLYAFLVSRWPPFAALSATIAPPSARQFASPTRSKFSSPLSPSIRVVQPLPGTHDGIEEHAASASAAANADSRFMAPPLDGKCISNETRPKWRGNSAREMAQCNQTTRSLPPVPYSPRGRPMNPRILGGRRSAPLSEAGVRSTRAADQVRRHQGRMNDRPAALGYWRRFPRVRPRAVASMQRRATPTAISSGSSNQPRSFGLRLADADSRPLPLREHRLLAHLGPRPPRNTGARLHVHVLREARRVVDVQPGGARSRSGSATRNTCPATL